MNQPRKRKTLAKYSLLKNMTLGAYAHATIAEQYRYTVKWEKHVIADKHPEDLHQMRVGSRRLRTALQVFGMAVALPKAGAEKRVRDLARALGQLRDLDVQIAALREDYQPQLGKKERAALTKVLVVLEQERSQVLTAVRATLSGRRYQRLKSAYKIWIEQPQYGAIATLPLKSLIPDLLNPLLCHLLLHPGWLVPLEDAFGERGLILHDLRKVCKHVRYQAEFFKPFYGKPFQQWIKEVKLFQEQLGKLNDTHVLMELLAQKLASKTRLPTLRETIHQEQIEAMAQWEEWRHKYLDPDYRYQLHSLLLESFLPETVKEADSCRNGATVSA